MRHLPQRGGAYGQTRFTVSHGSFISSFGCASISCGARSSLSAAEPRVRALRSGPPRGQAILRASQGLPPAASSKMPHTNSQSGQSRSFASHWLQHLAKSVKSPTQPETGKHLGPAESLHFCRRKPNPARPPRRNPSPSVAPTRSHPRSRPPPHQTRRSRKAGKRRRR